MRHTSAGSEVVYIDGDGKNKKGTIAEAITQGSARIELGKNSHAVATYSDSGGPGTFHYPDEADAVKEKAATTKKEDRAAAAPEKPTPPSAK